MSLDPKPVMSLIRSSDGLNLIREAARQSSLQKEVVKALPPNLQGQFMGCALRKGSLTIDWMTSAAANLARFHAPNLIERLQNLPNLSIREVRMRTRPVSSIPSKPPQPRQIPGEDALAHLSNITDHMPADELGQALRQLTETLRHKKRRNP